MLGAFWEHRLGGIEGVEVSSRFGAQAVHLVMNAERLPGRRVRRQIAQAIDRERFVDVLVREGGRRADGVLVPEQAGSVPAWASYGTESPLPIEEDREMELVFTRGELLGLMASYLRSELERMGADVDLVRLDADVFQRTWFPERRFDLALWEARSGPASWLSRWFDAAEGVSGLEDGELGALLRSADLGGGAGERALAGAQRRLANLVPILPLFQPKVAVGYRTGVGGLEANPSVDGPLWNAWEWRKAGAEAAEAA